jgi:hypothetical protein
MQKFFTDTVEKILDPTIGTEALFTLVAVGALVIAGMAIYAVTLAVNALVGRR